MELVTKQDLANLLLNKDIPFDERKELITQEFHIDLPPEIEDGEPLVDFVYDYYLKMVELYQLKDRTLYKVEKKPTERDGTIKEFIINIIMVKKNLSILELHKIVDDEYKYSEIGKTPRTRCRKVIQQLTLQKKIIVTSEKQIIWQENDSNN
jgi:hypothetical protein